MTAQTREDVISLPDGQQVRLRPLRPDDAAALQEGVRRYMSPEDLRLRFLAPVKELAPALLDRLTHPDPDREIALVVERVERPELLAVGRLAADPGSDAAEYAITVRSDMKGHGLGYMLMGRLLECARQRGCAEVFGYVLPENQAMLKMCREYGFTVESDAREPGVIRVAKRL